MVFDDMYCNQKERAGGQNIERRAQPCRQRDHIAVEAHIREHEHQIIGYGITEYGRIEGGMFATEKCLEGEIHLTALKKGPSGDERGHGVGPCLELVAKLTAQVGLLRVHDAFIVKPIHQRNDDKGPDIHSEDQDAGPDEIIGQVQRVTDNRIDADCVEAFGNLLVGIAAGSALWGGANRIGAQYQSRQREQECHHRKDDAQDMTLPHKEPHVEVGVAIDKDRNRQKEDENGDLPTIPEQEIA